MVKEIFLAGGCFWGVEKYFSVLHGVIDTEVGYANGTTENPSYEDVCKRGTDHAETVRVKYDADLVDLEFILDMYYKIIDPTSVNKQGGDKGRQYRTGIYFTDEMDRPVIEGSLKKLQLEYHKPLAVECGKLVHFYPGEEYHQKYLEKNPGGYCHIGTAAFKQAEEAKPADRYRRKSEAELKETLTELQYQVTRKNGTERPFENEYYDTFDKGIYVDITTGEPLFVSADKFESGCGWPSFSQPISQALLEEKADFTLGRSRTEVRSKTGDAHLGHVFNDGPQESGGMRYCINSAALRFVPLEEMEMEGYGKYIHLVK